MPGNAVHDRKIIRDWALRLRVRGILAIAICLLGTPASQLEAELPEEPSFWEKLQTFSQKGAEWLGNIDFDSWGEEYEFIGVDEWQDFFTSVLDALRGDSYEGLQILLPYVREGLNILREQPGFEPYADWLAQRLDYFEVAEEVVTMAPETPAPQPSPSVRPPPRVPLTPPEKPVLRPPPAVQARRDEAASALAIWEQRVRKRAVPPRAATLVPTLKAIFREEGVPEALVWIAEVESSFNPEARSPAGAAGLFQFMPATAQRFGLSLRPTDQRLNPESSARAAAKYLRALHRQFHDWPLAFAAYNAGEGRVARLLKTRAEKSFATIEAALPVETRMYVPKILAVISVREGIDAHSLPAPSASLGVPSSFESLCRIRACQLVVFTAPCSNLFSWREPAELPIARLLSDWTPSSFVDLRDPHARATTIAAQPLERRAAEHRPFQ